MRVLMRRMPVKYPFDASALRGLAQGYTELVEV